LCFGPNSNLGHKIVIAAESGIVIFFLLLKEIMRKNLVLALASGLISTVGIAATKPELFRKGEHFDLKVLSVRSLPPSRGNKNDKGIYAVEAESAQMRYSLYCSVFAPQAGTTYKALDEYVSNDLSTFHLWPVQRSSVLLPLDAPTKGNKVLYRVIIFEDVTPGLRPDVACDIHSETPAVKP
jgi:hypothetical protein